MDHCWITAYVTYILDYLLWDFKGFESIVLNSSFRWNLKVFNFVLNVWQDDLEYNGTDSGLFQKTRVVDFG